MSYSDGSHLEKGDGSRPSSAERLLFNGPGSDTTEHSDERSWSNARQYQVSFVFKTRFFDNERDQKREMKDAKTVHP